MKNLDKNTNMETLRAELFASMQGDDANAQEQAFVNFAKGLQDAIMDEAKIEMAKQGEAYNDEKILVNRGLMKPLTSEEKKYFNAVIQKEGFDNAEMAFPKTIIQDVFKNLKEEHPLLSRIDMQNTDVLAQMIFSKPQTAKGFWGTICEEIKQMIVKGFEVVDIKSSKLSGFVPVCKGMLELGPNWLANYVIEVIKEIMSASLELAIVQGNGKNQPIGMMKKLSGATDSVYPDKEKVSLNNFEPVALAGIRAAMAEAKTDTDGVCAIVNPITYWIKVFPSLAFKTQEGVWVRTTLPTGEEIIKSYAVPKDAIIFGDPKNYFVGVASDVTITKYTETLAIEDMDLFIAKFFGFGVAKDKNAFFVADVAGISGATVAPLETVAKNNGDNGANIITESTELRGV